MSNLSTISTIFQQTIQLYLKATSSPKARLNYTSPSGLKTQEEILHVSFFFMPQ